MGLFHSGSTLASVVHDLISFMNLCIAVLGPLALVIFFWGLIQYIYKSDDAKSREEGRATILWSLVAIFILFSVWGILSLINVSVFGGTLYGSYGGTYYDGASTDTGSFAPYTNSNGTQVVSPPPAFSTDFGGTAAPTPTPAGRPDFTPQ